MSAIKKKKRKAESLFSIEIHSSISSDENEGVR
jgi:hypothetical protein